MSRITVLRQVVRERRASRRRRPTTVALDVMGSDHGPAEVLRGAYDAIQQWPQISVIAVGDRYVIERTLRANGWVDERITVQHATQVVTMHDAPKDSLKKKDSSIAVCARLVHEGLADGVVSPGNTGATMAHCMMQWRTIPGVSRPAIATVLPHSRRPCVLLDVGANVDCKPKHLLHFALMGSCFSQAIFHRKQPKVGILTIGEEETKGNDLVLSTRSLLEQASINFTGNAEGRDLFKGQFDVVICDGFVGNVVLKFAEGLAEFIMSGLKTEVQSSIVTTLGGLAIRPAFKNFRKSIDHAEYGGAPLLGLNGTCIICHGSARARSIMNAIRVASEQVSASVKENIAQLVSEHAHIG